jgi:uncharacterized membrane protein YhdT
VALAVKGIIAYITPAERDFLLWLTWVEVACVLVIAIIFLIHGGDPFKVKGTGPK